MSPAVARRNEVDDAQTDEEQLVSNGEDPGKRRDIVTACLSARDPRARLIVATRAELNECAASVNKNAVTRSAGMPLLQRECAEETAHEPDHCFLCRGSRIRAGQELLT